MAKVLPVATGSATFGFRDESAPTPAESLARRPVDGIIMGSTDTSCHEDTDTMSATIAYDNAPASRRPRPPLDALHPALGVRHARGADDRARRRRLHLRRARQALPRRAGGPVRRPGSGTAAPSSPRRPPSRPPSSRSSRSGPTPTRARSTWPSTARRLRPRRPQPGLLHHRRRRGRRDRVEAGQAVLQAHRQADQAQGDQPRDRLPRHPAGRAVDHRAARHEGAVRAAGALDVPGAQHELLPRRRDLLPGPGRRATRSASGRRTGSPRRSSSRVPTPSRPCSSSRCRTPAAASRRRPATSSGSARSATSTTCCWSPTR